MVKKMQTDKIKIFYVTCLSENKFSGINSVIEQLFNEICNYANIYWLNLGDMIFEVDKRINIVNEENYIQNYDIAIFENPFQTTKYCKIAKNLKKHNIPYLIVPHGCFHNKALKRKALKKKIAMNTIFKNFLENSYGIQFLTNGEMNNSVKYNKSIIIPNGIADDKMYRQRNEIKNIIFVGRKDIEHKGIDLLLEACNNVKDELKKLNVKVYLYGPASKNSNFIKSYITKNNLENIIIDCDAITGKEKKDILYNADAYIQTSRYEGFPMSLLEAFTYGLPTIITEGTNLGNIVKEYNAGYIAKNNVESIEKVLKVAINDKKVCDKSANARKLSQHYLWDNVCKITIEEYSKIKI